MSSNPPLVTIYIPCKDYGKFLEQAANSVIQQLYPNWELIIINEGSSDDTEKIAKKIQKKIPDKISLISHKEPLGLQRLANKVLSIANGKYMMRLDADDWLDESAIFLLVNKIEASKKVGLVLAIIVIVLTRRGTTAQAQVSKHVPFPFQHAEFTFAVENFDFSSLGVRGETQNITRHTLVSSCRE